MPISAKSSAHDATWVPASCTLPTVDRPTRVAEFDDLFANTVRAAHRVGPTTLHLTVDADAEARARDLARSEVDCCSFFEFSFEPGVADTVGMVITVPEPQIAVLDALAVRAGAPDRAAGN